jgi:NTP pyrophosphatase (non-canonical NTP hydrolase)
MNFREYQKRVKETAIYPNVGNNFVYPALGLAGESGEVCEKIKKVLRDQNGVMDADTKGNLVKELGDVLWYAAMICNELDLDFDLVAIRNLAKLAKRRTEGKLHGSGDER